MTNGEKYKTADERVTAFDDYCFNSDRSCAKCPLKSHRLRGEIYRCPIHWLELEAEGVC